MILRVISIFVLSAVLVASLFLWMFRAIDSNEGWEDSGALPTQLDLADPGSCSAKDHLETIALDTIHSARSCYSNDQCVLTSYDCPFGCLVAVNSSRVEQIDRAVQNYAAYIKAGQCSRCVYRCRNFSNPGALCVNGHCELVDSPIPNSSEYEINKTEF